MKHIKPYKIFESASPNFPTTREEVIEVCEDYEIENYTINDDLSIDVDGDVRLYGKGLEYLPLKFNYVSGYFGCSNNNLETLKGCPQRVNGNFSCHFNKLKILKGCPQTVGGGFYCSNNKLKSLIGCPQTVDGDFYCSNNKLKSLEGSPQTVGGYFNCYRNELKTLEGSPQTVNGNFYCSYNKLKDLEHLPEVSGSINIEENTVYLLVYTFIENADSFMIEDFNDYEIVRNRDTVMLDRLQTFIKDNDLEMPDLEEIKKEYKIIE
jgi:hypothetical protein